VGGVHSAQTAGCYWKNIINYQFLCLAGKEFREDAEAAKVMVKFIRKEI
jgi:hypothetical protein